MLLKPSTSQGAVQPRKMILFRHYGESMPRTGLPSALHGKDMLCHHRFLSSLFLSKESKGFDSFPLYFAMLKAALRKQMIQVHLLI